MLISGLGSRTFLFCYEVLYDDVYYCTFHIKYSIPSETLISGVASRILMMTPVIVQSI